METTFKLSLQLALIAEVVTRSLNIVSLRQNKVNNRPVIGVLTAPTSIPTYGDEYIMAAYVQFLESAGARVVPIRCKQTPEYYSSLFKKINGVLFPGGESSTSQGPYFDSGKIMYELALKANGQGDYFPIWGTCLGFELLTELTAKKNLLNYTDSENLALPLSLAKGYRHSRLFKTAPTEIVDYMRFEPVALNNHQKSLLVESFQASSALREFYQVLSTNQDRNHEEFVSLMEAYRYPIYGSQWHPEKIAFVWKTSLAIDHSLHAQRVAQYMANFFVSEARKSNHRFESEDEEAREMVENARRVFIPDKNFQMNYYFDNKV